MPFADSCKVIQRRSRAAQLPRLPDNTLQVSRGKTMILLRADAGFTKCIRASVATDVVDGGLRGHVPARPECITPHIRFLFIAPRIRLGLPPHPASRRRTCPLAHLRLYTYLVPGLAPGKITAMHGTHAKVNGRQCEALTSLLNDLLAINCLISAIHYI